MHKYINLRVVSGLLGLGFLVVFVATSFSSIVSADTQQLTWFSPQSPSLVKQYDLSPAESVPTTIAGLGNRDCETTTVITRPSKPFQSQQTAQSCFVKTSFGLVDSSGTLIRFNGAHLAGQTTSYTDYQPGMIAIPNSTSVIEYMSAPPNGLFLYVTRSIPGPIKTTRNLLTGEVAYNFTRAADSVLKDSTGAQLAAQTDSLSFSSNGKWMVVDLPNRAMVRVNLDTMEILPFMNPFSYMNGDTPGAQTAISNNGRYALVSSRSYSLFKIFDLSSCSNIPANITGPATCQSRDLLPFMQSQFSGYIAASQLRFTSDTIVSLFGVWNPGSGTVRTQTTLLAPGQTQTKVTYMAMGDSFTSGEGDTKGSMYYEPGTDAINNKCHLSQRSYPYLLSSALVISDFHSVACSGAVIRNVDSASEEDIQYIDSDKALKLGEWIPGNTWQLNYLHFLSAPDFLTISIGGNNVGFADIVTECVTSHLKIPLPNTCKYASDQTERGNVAKRVADQYTPLKNVYKELIKATNNKTKIYVVGYPQFVKESGGSCGVNVHLNEEERYFVSQGTHYMNQVIKAAADAAGVYYLDIENALQDRNLCSVVADNLIGVNGLTEGNDQQAPWWAGLLVGGLPGVVAAHSLGIGNESFHPNPNGHILMENKILGLTGNDLGSFVVCSTQAAVICPHGDDKVPLPDSAYFGSDAVVYANSQNSSPTTALSAPPQPTSLILNDLPPGNQIHIRLQYLLPGSSVAFTTKSTNSTLLGSFIVKDDGSLDATVTVPSAAEVGFQTLHASAVNIAGESRDYYEPIFVPGPTGDINGNGVADTQETCGFATLSGTDIDHDGIDDACDGDLATPVTPKVTVTVDTLRIAPFIPR